MLLYLVYCGRVFALCPYTVRGGTASRKGGTTLLQKQMIGGGGAPSAGDQIIILGQYCTCLLAHGEGSRLVRD